MIILQGKYADCKVFTTHLDNESQSQLISILNHPISKDAHIRIMPDVHAGAGCVIGFTSLLTDMVIPNLIGVDIGCGVLSAVFNEFPISFSELDAFIKANIPASFDINDEKSPIDHQLEEKIKEVAIRIKSTKYSDYVLRSIGTLGGGNHFIEVERGDRFYLTVHTGSRNLGKEIAKYHQQVAVNVQKSGLKEDLKSKIADIKNKFNGKEIEREIIKLKNSIAPKVRKGQEFLVGHHLNSYISDMKLAQEFAQVNRRLILDKIINYFKLEPIKYIESVHNYINFNDNIVRKGAISAHKGEEVIIPLNMKDGVIIGKGLGNEDWNFSAPHGAGRRLSRRRAKETISLEEFSETMEGIYSSSITEQTIDEAPQAYKDADEIINYLKDTVEIVEIAKPLYVFKGG